MGKKKAQTLKTQVAVIPDGSFQSVGKSAPGSVRDLTLLRRSDLLHQIETAEGVMLTRVATTSRRSTSSGTIRTGRDARSEIELYSQFKQAAFSRSAVMISHRLGAALMSDRIVLLDAGKIVEFGTHVDLLRQRGHYARMWEIQSAWFIDEELRSNHG